MRVYVDSDVLIWHLRGERRALELRKKLRDNQEYELWIGALQRAEVIFFLRPGEEDATEFLLSEFRTAPVDQAVAFPAQWQRVSHEKWQRSYTLSEPAGVS